MAGKTALILCSKLSNKEVVSVYTKEFLESLKHAETVLQYDSFDQEDAYRLGTKLREVGMKD